MGINVFLEGVASYGYNKCATAAATCQQNVDGINGGRVAVRAFGFTCGSVATSLYFMNVAGTTTTNGAPAAGNSTVKLSSLLITAAKATLATKDHICLEMDNGVYHFTTCGSVGVATIEIIDALVDTMADGNTVWAFGVEGDGGVIAYDMAANTQATKEVDSGIFYGSGKGHPMIIKHLSLTSSTVGAQDYVTIGYINR